MPKISLKMARIKTGMTQEEIAKKLGISRNTYMDYERYDTPMRITTAIDFCRIVDIPMDEIFFEKNYTSSVCGFKNRR